jgi:hypothetical protein
MEPSELLYHRFFVIKNKSLLEKISKFDKQSDDNYAATIRFAEKYKFFKPIFRTTDYRVVGVANPMTSQVDSANWKTNDSHNGSPIFTPKRNTSEGKAIYKEMENLPPTDFQSEMLEVLGITKQNFEIWESRSEFHRRHLPHIQLYKNEAFLRLPCDEHTKSLPSSLQDAEEITEYQFLLRIGEIE